MLGPILSALIGGATLFLKWKAKKSADYWQNRQLELEQRAYQQQMNEKIKNYQFDIQAAGLDIEHIQELKEENIADIQEEGARFTRQQRAYLGAAGAEIGTGTPLLTMLETAAGIKRNIERVKTEARQQTESAEQQIEFDIEAAEDAYWASHTPKNAEEYKDYLEWRGTSKTPRKYHGGKYGGGTQ